MAQQKKSSGRSPAPRRNAPAGGGAGKLLLGLVLGIALTLVSIVAYFYFGRPPVAATDRAALWEHFLYTIPLEHRAAAEAKQPPFSADEDGFEAAAHQYRAHCAQCHGTPGHDSVVGRGMVPHAQQFFSIRDRAATQSQSAGALYWETAFGVRRSGMPAYNHVLTNQQLWQMSLLLHSAADLPDPVRSILTQNTQPSTQVLPAP